MIASDSPENVRFERDLAARLESAVGGSSATAMHFNDDLWHQLSSQEKHSLARAVAKRRREFAAGRAAARQCASALGIKMSTLAIGPQRQPCWPSSLVGSISHDNLSALAWVAPADCVDSLGLDVELTGRLKRDTWRLLFTDSELSWLDQSDDRCLALRLFSAKESVYKCIFPRVRRYVGYKEVTLSPGAEDSLQVTPDAQLAQESGLSEMKVGTLNVPHRLATWCFIPAAARSGT